MQTVDLDCTLTLGIVFAEDDFAIFECADHDGACRSDLDDAWHDTYQKTDRKLYFLIKATGYATHPRNIIISIIICLVIMLTFLRMLLSYVGNSRIVFKDVITI